MKYLKEYNSHSYYQEINFDEYIAVADSLEVINKADINYIKNNLNFKFDQKLALNSTHLDIKVAGSRNYDIIFDIVKTEDEWFYVEERKRQYGYRIWELFFKCDQLEGLIKFINDRIQKL